MPTTIDNPNKKVIPKGIGRRIARGQSRTRTIVVPSNANQVLEAIRHTSPAALDHSRRSPLSVAITAVLRRIEQTRRNKLVVSRVLDGLNVKPLTENWDVIGVINDEVIMRRHFLNGKSEEFVIEKQELESKGLTGLRPGRRIEVSRDPSTQRIHYKLQKYTYLKLPSFLQAVVDRTEQAV